MSHNNNCIKSDGDWICAGGCTDWKDQEEANLRTELAEARKVIFDLFVNCWYDTPEKSELACNWWKKQGDDNLIGPNNEKAIEAWADGKKYK
jgi:hypothetical protein